LLRLVNESGEKTNCSYGAVSLSLCSSWHSGNQWKTRLPYQKVDSYTGRYRDMYLCDNEMQLLTAMEDFEYTKWLDPDMVPCYVKDDEDTESL